MPLLIVFGVLALGVFVLFLIVAVAARSSARPKFDAESRAYWEEVAREREAEEPHRRVWLSRLAAALADEGVTLQRWAAETKQRRGGPHVSAPRLRRMVEDEAEPVPHGGEVYAAFDAGDRLLRQAGWTGREITALEHGEDMAERVFGPAKYRRVRVADLRAGDRILVSRRGEVGPWVIEWLGHMATIDAIETSRELARIELSDGHRLELSPGDWVHRSIDEGGGS